MDAVLAFSSYSGSDHFRLGTEFDALGSEQGLTLAPRGTIWATWGGTNVRYKGTILTSI